MLHLRLTHLASRTYPFRWWFVATAIVGAIVCGSLIAITRTRLGFALAGPLCMFPWFMACGAFWSKNVLSPSLGAIALVPALFLLLCAVIGLVWPLIVYG